MFQHLMWIILGMAFFCVGIVMMLSNFPMSAQERFKYTRYAGMAAIFLLTLWLIMFLTHIFR